MPALPGEPLPITVLQQMSVGSETSARAASIARATAAGSWPSTPGTTCHPYAWKRFGVSSRNQPRTSPSIDIPLSS